MGEFSKVEIEGHLMVVTINRPEVYNACLLYTSRCV